MRGLLAKHLFSARQGSYLCRLRGLQTRALPSHLTLLSRSPLIDVTNADTTHLKETNVEQFTLYPAYLTTHEQHTLLKHALVKLDTSLGISRSVKQHRRLLGGASNTLGEGVKGLFMPENCYDFDEGHYDNVIHHYREAHVSSPWPEEAQSVLQKVLDIFPMADRVSASPRHQIHLLHLASRGEILPHIDNVGASGGVIMGISLGATRILRLYQPDGSLTAPSTNKRGWVDITLESGSVYIQKDTVRYQFQHSIPLTSASNPGQRLSVMIRDGHSGL